MSYRFAIVGCGRIARRHAQHLVHRGSLQAVCDVVPEKARELAGKYTATAYDSIEAMLAAGQADVVAVCTPNGMHATHAIQAMEAGCHVLCEKPMALSVADGQRMIQTARRTGRKLFVVKQNRYNPPVEKIKQLLQQNRLGKIYSFQVNCFWNRPASYYQDNWHGSPDMDGGTLFTQFSHFIDLLYWLLGDIKTVQGLRRNFLHQGQIAFEDTGAWTIELASGAIGTFQYTVNTYPANLEGSITILGEKGTVKIGGQYLNVLEHFTVANEPFPELPAGNPPNQYGFYEGSMSNHDKVYDQLFKALQQQDHQSVEADDGLKTVAIIEALYAAAGYSIS